MKRSLFALVGAIAFAAGSGVAFAQQEEEPAPPPAACPPGEAPVIQQQVPVAPPSGMYQQQQPMYQQQPPVVIREREVVVREHRRAAFSPDNMSLTIGGGVGNFARDRSSDTVSGVAGTWDARFLYGTRSFLGVEASYVGSAADGNDAFGIGRVMTEQVNGALRFNLTRARIQPFLTAGAGYANLHRTLPGATTVSGITVSENKNAFEAPFMGGLAGYIGRHAVVDLRGGYTIVTAKDFGLGARPDLWSAELRAGYAF